jgi:hypothetical protein
MHENIRGQPFIFFFTPNLFPLFSKMNGEALLTINGSLWSYGRIQLVFFSFLFLITTLVLASSHGTCFCWFFKHSGYVYIMLLGAIGFTSLSLDEELFLFWCYRLFYFGKKFVLVLYQLDIVRIKCTWIIILSFLNTKVYVGKAV